MNPSAVNPRLAACSWSLLPTDPHDLAAKLSSVGLHRVQLALDPLHENPAVWRDTGSILKQAGIAIVSGMFGCLGEDYSSLESIRATGGIAPDATWDQNLRNIRATANLAAELRLPLVSFHAGILPHDQNNPDSSKILPRLITVAQLFARENIDLILETGQEPAEVLADVLAKLDQPNLGVNFDPANMILYGNGDPIHAMLRLKPWIRQVHIKDAKAAPVPGIWGEEVVAGTGDVDWQKFFAALKQMNYAGNFVIEREAGTQRIADIGAARAVVERSLA